MFDTVLTALLVVANVTGAGMIVPQVLRLHRHREPGGVSAGWLGVGITMNTWWTAYGVAESRWGIVPVSVGALALYVVLAVQLHGLGRPVAQRAGAAAAPFVALPALALAVGGWPAAGLTIGAAYAIQFVPAAHTALHSTDLRGISVTTWGMALTEALIWALYGVADHDAALTIGGVGGAASASVILARLAWVAGGRRLLRVGPQRSEALL